MKRKRRSVEESQEEEVKLLKKLRKGGRNDDFCPNFQIVRVLAIRGVRM